MANELVPVPFHGDVIEAVQDERGIWVPLLRPCEALGIKPHGQAEKLKSKTWATTQMICVVAADGKQRDVLALHLDCVPMWLATIESNKVKPDVREKLALYQREAAKVLADHFLGRKALPAPPALDVQALSDRIADVVTETVTERVSCKLTALLADLRERHSEPPVTIKERIAELGWATDSAPLRDKVRNLALSKIQRRGHARPFPESDARGAELLFLPAVVPYLDEAIEQIWRQEERRNGPSLYA